MRTWTLAAAALALTACAAWNKAEPAVAEAVAAIAREVCDATDSELACIAKCERELERRPED